jgi:hypothetical protein
MKKRSFLPTAAGLSLGIFLLSGCAKVLDHLPPVPPGTVPCKMTYFIFPAMYHPGVVDSFTFAYNSLGNPVFAARAILDDGTPDVEFTYDNHNRLTGFLNVFSPGAAPGSSFNWIKYSYTDDKSENPYIDSNFLFPFDVVNGSPTSYANLNTDNFQYDRDNRIIQDTSFAVTLILQGFDEGGDTTVFTYKYGPDGNQEGGKYDNKVNFLRTSKVFQFVQANYCVNNGISDWTNIKYNEFGLPTQFDATNGIGFLGAVSAPGTIRIEYDCTCGLSNQKGLRETGPPAAGQNY